MPDRQRKQPPARRCGSEAPNADGLRVMVMSDRFRLRLNVRRAHSESYTGVPASCAKNPRPEVPDPIARMKNEKGKLLQMKKYWNQMKELSERMSNETRIVLLEMDKKYNSREAQLIELERAYESMGLQKRDRANIDALLKLREEIENDASTIAYMAGLMDAVFLLDKLDITEC